MRRPSGLVLPAAAVACGPAAPRIAGVWFLACETHAMPDSFCQSSTPTLRRRDGRVEREEADLTGFHGSVVVRRRGRHP